MPQETPRHTSRLLNMAVPMQDSAPLQAVPIDAGILARAETIDQTALLTWQSGLRTHLAATPSSRLTGR